MDTLKYRGIRTFVISLLASAVLAAAGVSAARQIGLDLASDGDVVQEEPGTEDGGELTCPEEGDDGSTDDGSTEALNEDGSEGEDGSQAEECEEADPEGDPEGDPEDTETPELDAEREAACMTAAGMTTEEAPIEDGSEIPVAEETVEEPEVGKSTGLDRAMEVVLANCIKNPQAPGLLNALERLAANKAKHQAHDEAKAAAKQARADAKLAKQQAKADAKAAKGQAKAAKGQAKGKSGGHGKGKGHAGG